MSAVPVLNPDPTVIVVQGVIFLIAVTIVKKFFIEPYRTIKAARTKMTTGAVATSAEIVLKNQHATKTIEGHIQGAVNSARAQADAIRKAALQKQQAAQDTAKAQADDLKRNYREKINSEFAAAEAQLSSLVKTATSQVVAKLLN
jgi:F0F1-type ATP synthase membrane subunit b/b'